MGHIKIKRADLSSKLDLQDGELGLFRARSGQDEYNASLYVGDPAGDKHQILLLTDGFINSGYLPFSNGQGKGYGLNNMYMRGWNLADYSSNSDNNETAFEKFLDSNLDGGWSGPDIQINRKVSFITYTCYPAISGSKFGILFKTEADYAALLSFSYNNKLLLKIKNGGKWSKTTQITFTATVSDPPAPEGPTIEEFTQKDSIKSDTEKSIETE